MWDFEPVQELGFKNIYRNSKAIGFQLLYRLPYYRGLWLSMSKGFSVMVDGELFPRDAITVTLHGKTYTQDEAANAWNAWCLLRTGADSAGVRWPIFHSRFLGVENSSLLFVYGLLPFQTIGGLGIWTTRLAAAADEGVRGACAGQPVGREGIRQRGRGDDERGQQEH